jgi:hypothetical protein
LAANVNRGSEPVQTTLQTFGLLIGIRERHGNKPDDLRVSEVILIFHDPASTATHYSDIGRKIRRSRPPEQQQPLSRRFGRTRVVASACGQKLDRIVLA